MTWNDFFFCVVLFSTEATTYNTSIRNTRKCGANQATTPGRSHWQIANTHVSNRHVSFDKIVSRADTPYVDTQHRHRATRALYRYHTFHDGLLDNEFTKSVKHYPVAPRQDC
jgi:hypothetical protein